MGYTQQDNGKWKRKGAFLHFQVFSLTVGNEKREENYVREIQDTIMIRITVSISSCERAALKFRPSQQPPRHQCLQEQGNAIQQRLHLSADHGIGKGEPTLKMSAFLL